MSYKKDYIHYIIALIIGLALRIAILPINGLTEKGVLVITILIPILYLWLTTNTHWVSLLALALLVMTQAMTPNEVWAGSMGHFVVITIISYMMLNVCLKETGVINKIAIFFVTRSFVQNRPYAFMAMFFASNIITGMFMDNLSLAIIYVGIASVLCEEIGVKKGEPFYTCIFTGIMWGNVILSIASPIAHALPNIIMGIAESQLGLTITYAQWLAVGVPFSLLMFIAIMICVRLWSPDTSAFKNFDVEELKKKYPPLDARGKFATFVFVVVVVMVLLPTILKDFFPGGIWDYLNSLGVAVPAMIAIAILSIVSIGGKPVLDTPAAMKQIPLPMVIFAGTVSVFAVPLSSEATGITVWMGNTLRPLVANLPPIAIIIVLIILAIAMTNFLSNTVTMVLFFNIGAVLLVEGDVNMAAFTIVIALAASMATVTPSAAVPSPLFFGPGHITVKNTLKYNLCFVAISFIVLIAFCIPYASAMLR